MLQKNFLGSKLNALELTRSSCGLSVLGSSSGLRCISIFNILLVPILYMSSLSQYSVNMPLAHGDGPNKEIQACHLIKIQILTKIVRRL